MNPETVVTFTCGHFNQVFLQCSLFFYHSYCNIYVLKVKIGTFGGGLVAHEASHYNV